MAHLQLTYYNHADRSSGEEDSGPYQELEEFFGDTNLEEIKALFDKIFETCMTTDEGPFSRAEERSTLLIMRNKIEKALQAGFQIVAQRDRETAHSNAAFPTF